MSIVIIGKNYIMAGMSLLELNYRCINIIKLFSYISNKLARILLGVEVSDYTNGFRIYSRRSAKSVVKDCGKIGDGFIILSEILLNIAKKKYKIGEINSIFINRVRGHSSVTLKLIIESFFGLIRLFLILKFFKN